MCKTKLTIGLVCGLFSVAVVAAQSDDVKSSEYHEVQGKAKPDDSICGFNVNKTPMKSILEKLGEPSNKNPYPDDPAQTIFTWDKGQLRIVIAAYTSSDSYFPNGHPIAIAAEGSDPDKFCKTGKGLMLGDPLDKALKIYAKPGNYSRSIVNEKQYSVTFRWGEEDTDVHVESDKKIGITRIEVTEEE